MAHRTAGYRITTLLLDTLCDEHTHISLELVAVLAAAVCVGHAEPAPGAHRAALGWHSRLARGATIERADARHVEELALPISPAQWFVLALYHTRWC